MSRGYTGRAYVFFFLPRRRRRRWRRRWRLVKKYLCFFPTNLARPSCGKNIHVTRPSCSGPLSPCIGKHIYEKIWKKAVYNILYVFFFFFSFGFYFLYILLLYFSDYNIPGLCQISWKLSTDRPRHCCCSSFA